MSATKSKVIIHKKVISMKTIIAEKPSVAREIARIVGATKREEGYFEGGGYAVTWAFGHLVQLAMPTVTAYAASSVTTCPSFPKPSRSFPVRKRQRKIGRASCRERV